MPVIQNNDFANDTHGSRAERLNAIQGNFASIQPDLQAPANIADWADDCYDVYSQILANSGVEASESEGATLDATLKGDLMEEEYQNARTLGIALYVDNPVKLKDFNFETVFPDSRNNKIARVDQVLETNTRHIADGISPVLPTTIIDRLTDAKDDYVAALKVQDKERADAREAVADLKERFDSDTKMLQKLRAWFYAMLGKQDPRIDLVGMVNPQSGGGGTPTPVPAAPTNLVYHPEVPSITWDPVVGATSYEVQHKTDSATEWNIIYTGTDTNLLHGDPVGDYVARVRSRNSGGFSDFSNELEYSVGSGPGD